ncbi:hypothetical protein SLEP1_g46390 [Rubroshorea leprosula]|uniref:Leucine-rich repeat-containing N-terminal plant-type domain-containing protein n=1 Tax=Rubroshorea leprosula TaxID=152421 RepID=A0AAV5LM39_9ROSI|nr:hypothetical protein SLEP1_g46390 [Rubroshorea leprosula]
MRIFTKLSAPLSLCLLFVFLCLKTAFSSSIHASSFSTTHLCSHEEALALLQFKTSFSIDYTVSDPNYCGDHFYSKIESWKEGIDCCSWDGVSCDNVIGHVIALNLSCSFLYGTFPSNNTLFFLRNLQSLNLALNDFRLSKIPSEISQFTRLKHLDVSSSGFSGQVPREIAHLPMLVSLNLSNSDLILEATTFKNLVHNLSEVRELELGGVDMTSVNPRFFMNLSSSLTTLDLWESCLGGNFPNSIFHFPNLKNFYLSGMQNLTIDLPSSNWSSPLQQLYLDDMDCGRRLPESVGDLKSLQSLSLFYCNLEGSIPTSIGNLSELASLDLSSNQFSGPIPASIGNLRQLTSLILYSNNLSGQIPSSLANLTQLPSLDLSNHQFSGPIPASIGNLRQLTSLDLSSNNLSRQIPSSLANLTQLTYLSLSYNQFSSPIPVSIGNLRQLTGLYLYSNNLSGQIPSSLANLTQLTYLSLSYNQFSGPIPASIDELKLMLGGAELSGSIEEEEQDMIGSVLEMKDAHVREILAANAQKLNAVRFEQINNGEAMSEAKDVTRLIPKIMKRKGNGDKLDNITYVENAFQKRQENRLSDRYHEYRLLTEITPKSIAVHNPTEDMIETALEIKDTHVREAITPLVNVVAIDASATLVDFHHLWVTHQYSR